MTKHTPGPWKAAAGIITAPDFGWKGATVARALHYDHGSDTHDTLRAEANARLIAAAPAMLAALEKAFEFIAKHSTGNPYLTEPGKTVAAAIAAATEA